MVYTVTFNPAIDYVVHIKDIHIGATNHSDSEEIYFGGKGINVSVVLKELGVNSKALGFTAGFTGEQIEKKYPVQSKVYLLKDLLPEFVRFQKDYGMFGWCWAKLFPTVLAEGICFDEILKLA